MKLRIFAIIALLVTLLLLMSCFVTSRDISVEISCDEFYENTGSMINDFQMEVGDKIRVNLCSNPTAGFQWEYKISRDTVLKEEDHDFEEPEGGAVGASGIEVWTFEAIGKGTTEVLMEYSQPWEGGEKKEWTYKMTITVE